MRCLSVMSCPHRLINNAKEVFFFFLIIVIIIIFYIIVTSFPLNEQVNKWRPVVSRSRQVDIGCRFRFQEKKTNVNTLKMKAFFLFCKGNFLEPVLTSGSTALRRP